MQAPSDPFQQKAYSQYSLHLLDRSSPAQAYSSFPDCHHLFNIDPFTNEPQRFVSCFYLKGFKRRKQKFS